MSISISLSNKMQLSKNENDNLTLQKETGECFTLQNGQIIRNGRVLNRDETQTVVWDILKAGFGIPEEMNIIKLKHSGKSSDNLSLKIETRQQNDTLNIDFTFNKGKIRLERQSSWQKSASDTKTVTEICTMDKTNKEFSENTYRQENIGGDIYSSTICRSSKRNINSKGNRICLEMQQAKEDSELPEFTGDKTTLEISADKISKIVSNNNDKFKRKLKISYNLRQKTIQCIMQETEYDAYVLTEYKNTLLTPVLKKKAEIRTPFDRNFKGTLNVEADGRLKYTQKETQYDMTEKEYSVENDTSKISEIMLEEVKNIKEIAAKITIIKNSQAQTEQPDFSRHAGIFDEYGGFSRFKENETMKLTVAFWHTGNDKGNLLNSLLAQLKPIIQSNNITAQLVSAQKNGR